LLRLALLVEDFHRLPPACLCGTVQCAELTKGSLPRTIRRAYGFHERPVDVILAVLRPLRRTQKHAGSIFSGDAAPFQGVGLHSIGFSESVVAGKSTYAH
jgi:hypothetical protein